MVPPDSSRISRVRPYLRNIRKFTSLISNTRLSLSLANLPRLFFYQGCMLVCLWEHSRMLLQHHRCNGLTLTHVWFRLFPFRSSLLRESHIWFLFLCYLDISVRKVSARNFEQYGFTVLGFPIRRSWSITLLGSFSRRFARLVRPSSDDQVKVSTLCLFVNLFLSLLIIFWYEYLN